jgi:UDP-2-acetamido-2,6-beta-L-arabino-hexul-4-ose reductase
MSGQIVVTGGEGFIGKNLRLRLREEGFANVVSVGRETSEEELNGLLANADFIFHLAGVNRPSDPSEFATGNAGFTERICTAVHTAGRAVPVALASSTQASLDNPYGQSKLGAEQALQRYGAVTGAPVYILRLTNVFGKWARPNYNSAVATFCHNIVRGLPITVNDAGAQLRLLYIDDAVTTLIGLLRGDTPSGNVDAGPVYSTTVGEVVEILRSFAESRKSMVVPAVGSGLARALYATYLSHFPPSEFTYALRRHADPRGVFVEMLKTPANGQISFFTAGLGVTRGEHYHHTKTEKFLVVKGTARFAFRHILTDEVHDVIVNGDEPRVVETVPGWAHNITNVGDVELVVMLWANEIFDPSAPDTYACKVERAV